MFRARRVVLAGLAVPALVASLGVLAAPPASAWEARDAALRRSVGTLMASPLVTASTSRVGVAVNDAVDGHPIYLRSDTTSLAPASTLKLLTAAAGLHYLGSGYRWRTETWVAAGASRGVVSGNVYLKGFGDPTLMERDLLAIAQAFRAKGITRISGGVVVDGSYFDGVRYNPAWSSSYASDYYAAQVSALTLAPDTDYDSGTLIVSYAPGSAAGQPARLGLTPPSVTGLVAIVNRTRTVASGSASTVTATRTPGGNTITLTGQVPLGSSPGKKWVTVNDPARYAGWVLRAQFAKAGIHVAGAVSAGRVPSGGIRMTQRVSITLGQLLVPMLKLSSNAQAEAITKTLGTRFGRPGNWRDGLEHLRRYAVRLGVPTSGLTLVDGSGLARSDRLTTATLISLVYRVQREPWFATFRAALPVAGTQPVRWVGGTLATRMRGTPAAGNLRAKNGSLTGVTSLAGYVTGADGRRYVFAMVSSYSGSSPRPVEDRLGVLLARWRMTNP